MLETIFSIIVYIFVVVSVLMLIRYCLNIMLTCKYFRNNKKDKYRLAESEPVNMLVLLPCLREQNVIAKSIDYFTNMNLDGVNLYLCIACTKRETTSNGVYGFDKTTADVARSYISHVTFPANITVSVFEAEDYNGGDRATQMNYAVDLFIKNNPSINVDIVAAFDADSRPTINTFVEVACKYKTNPTVSYQQPDVYVGSAQDILKEGRSMLAMANALYQNSWTMISEIPMLMRYAKKNGKYRGYFYCNGHGEFFPYEVWKRYRFPEHEITDGIHIGYRLGMSGAPVEILDNYGNTDAPHDIKALPKQHKRWFGGCMRLISCYKWCKQNGFKPKKTMVMAGFWSQFRWAFTATLFLINFVLSVLLTVLYGNYIPLSLMGGVLVTYCYLFGLLALKVTPVKIKTPISAFLLIPLAIYLKSIGPKIYIFEKLGRKRIVYEKVER